MKNFTKKGPLRMVSARTAVEYLFILMSIIVTSASCTHEPSYGTVTENIIKAYGGRERLAKVVSIAAEGRITALVRGDEGVYRRALKREGKLFVDIIYKRSTEQRILNGPKGYRGTKDRLEQVSGPRYLAMVYQYNELNLPYGFLDNSYTVSEIGKDRLNGQEVRVFRCTDHANNVMEVSVSTENYRIVKISGTFAMGSQSTSLSSVYTDFRSVDGILFPFRIDNYADGFKISEITITRYMVNPPIDDSLFSP
jgi:hypothetical protein